MAWITMTSWLLSLISMRTTWKPKYVIKVMLGYLECQKLILSITCLNNNFLEIKWYGGICYSKLHKCICSENMKGLWLKIKKLFRKNWFWPFLIWNKLSQRFLSMSISISQIERERAPYNSDIHFSVCRMRFVF